MHHELCFGCGRSNLFGLLLEVEATEPGEVAGRAHAGVVAAALCEALALACGVDARTVACEVTLSAPAPVGVFLELEARVESSDDRLTHASAIATADGALVGSGRGSYRRRT